MFFYLTPPPVPPLPSWFSGWLTLLRWVWTGELWAWLSLLCSLQGLRVEGWLPAGGGMGMWVPFLSGLGRKSHWLGKMGTSVKLSSLTCIIQNNFVGPGRCSFMGDPPQHCAARTAWTLWACPPKTSDYLMIPYFQGPFSSSLKSSLCSRLITVSEVRVPFT